MFNLVKVKSLISPKREDDFDQVYLQYQQYVLRLAFNLVGNWADAEDVAQEVFIGVNKGLAGFKGESQLSTWIYRITIRVACRYLSKMKATAALTDAVDADTIAQPAPEYRKQNLAKIMSALPLEQRTILSLVAFEGLSQQQIADILNIPVGTVGSRLHTARKNLSALIAGKL